MQLNGEEIETFAFSASQIFLLSKQKKNKNKNKISFNKNSDFLIDYFKIIILTASYLVISVLYVSFIVHSAT